MSLILAIESSTEVCSVALIKNGKVIDIAEDTEGMNHSKLLTVYCEDIAKRNNLKFQDLDAFTVSKGPGSYTGLRIGVSAVKGLCYVTGKPMISISSLDTLANYVSKIPDEFNIQIDSHTLLCPMIDARRMEVYTALYNSNGEIILPISAKIIDKESFKEYLKDNKIFFFGNGSDKCKNEIIHPNAFFTEPKKISARFMAYLSEVKYNNKEFEDVAYFEPFYLKDFIATVPKNKVIK